MKNTIDKQTLTLLRDSYLMLQRLSNESVKVGIETDLLRASLRNKISEFTDIDGQELQKEVEAIAFANPIFK